MPLTHTERAERDIRERDFQTLVLDLAIRLGWDWLHVEPGLRTKGRWWTATTGTLHAWPDLVLLRIRDRRLLFVELKRELGKTTPEQEATLEKLRALEGSWLRPLEGEREIRGDEERHAMAQLSIEIHVWRPSDLRDEAAAIVRTLR